VSGKKQARVELHELAFLYALGALEDEDQRIFEEHLRRGCTACEAELRSLGEVTASLGSAVQAEPPAGLRSRLLAKVRSAPRVPGVLFEQAAF
jgi:anti-sigma factor RsiW